MFLPGVKPGADYKAYIAYIQSPHDFSVDVDVLNMEERVLTSLRPRFLDGQVNLQREGEIKRTASFSFYDPNHALHLDPASPFAGGIFANRMIRYRYIVTVPGVGRVVATPFVGPAGRVSRDGDVLVVECNDKAVLAIEGCPVKTVKKGRNAVDAIRAIMRDCTGEQRFRFPEGDKRRLKKSYSVGWKTEASPWAVCQKIAKSIDMQLVYACDGSLLLRRRPKTGYVLDLTGLTTPVRSDQDISQVRNYVRVTGEKKHKAGTHAPKHIKNAEFTVGALPPREHPLSPRNLGRNSVNRYKPLLIDDPNIHKEREAQRRANDELADALPMGVTASFSGVPFYHLDWADRVRADTDRGALTLPFVEGSLPLGLGGDAEYGAQKLVSKPKGR